MRAIFTRDIAFLALAIVGCTHAKTTEAITPTAAVKAPATERAPSKLPAAPTSEKPKRVPTPLAAWPVGLLRPGSEQKIHEKLTTGGFMKDDTNGSTEAALRRFQAAHDLPATGAPDHETVRRLGLNPDDLFLKAAP